MELRNSVDSLKTLLEVSSSPSMQTPSTVRESSSGSSPLKGDSATLSSAGSEIAQGASSSELRSEKVVAIQAALASGTYRVPASAVAGKVVNAMLSPHVPED